MLQQIDSSIGIIVVDDNNPETLARKEIEEVMSGYKTSYEKSNISW